MPQAWTDERTSTLTLLWRDHSASEIAEKLGITKNAVIGKAHRLDLPCKKHTPNHTRRVPPKRAGTVRVRAAIPSAPPAPLSTVSAVANAHNCQWPIGDPRQPGFAYCGEQRELKKPYCSYHVRQSCLR
jgi:GcrA cell cycle regulator